VWEQTPYWDTCPQKPPQPRICRHQVELGELAQQKGTSDKVKDFGQKMVTHHSKAGDDLKQVAQQQGLNLPEEMSKQDRATYDWLSKLEGKQFDEAYARAGQLKP